MSLGFVFTLSLFVLIGCRPQPAPGVTPVLVVGETPTAVVALEPPSLEAATAVPNPIPDFATAVPLLPTATGVYVPAGDATASDAPEIGCGVYLPLTAAVSDPPLQRLDVTWPDDVYVPEEARPALDYLLANPANVGLAAYWVGREDQGVYLNAAVPMPLASVVKVIHLAAYAEAASDGRIDPAAWVEVADLEQYFLPGSDLQAHPRGIEELTDRGLIGRDPLAIPMEELPWMMIRHSSNAATDYLHMRLGQAVIEETAVALGLESQTAPCPFLGQFLLISNHTRVTDNDLAIRALIDDPLLYGSEVMRLTELYSGSDAFRQAEGRWFQRGRRPSWASQSLFSEQLNAQGSALDYANLMATIGQNGLTTPYASFLARRYLEWPMAAYPVNEALFHMVGYKNGSLPGILNTVYYASPRNQGGLVVVALFYRRLPQGTYQAWRRDLPHDELARWLLTDPLAIPTLRELLMPKT